METFSLQVCSPLLNVFLFAGAEKIPSHFWQTPVKDLINDEMVFTAPSNQIHILIPCIEKLLMAF